MTIAEIHAELVAAILVLRDRDGLPVTDDHARERANIIVTWLRDEIPPAPSDLFEPSEIVGLEGIRNVRCDGKRCGKLIESDGVAVQVARAPQRMFAFYHRGCRP